MKKTDVAKKMKRQKGKASLNSPKISKEINMVMESANEKENA